LRNGYKTVNQDPRGDSSQGANERILQQITNCNRETICTTEAQGRGSKQESAAPAPVVTARIFPGLAHGGSGEE
jgi:hypothetical protein